MAANFELMSFINEFMHLNSYGFNAKLELQSYYGKVFVNLNTEIGYVSPPPVPSSTVPLSTHCTTSRARRRRRRAAEKRMDVKQCQEPFSPSTGFESVETVTADLIKDDLKNDAANGIEIHDVCSNQPTFGRMPDPMLPIPADASAQAVKTQTSEIVSKDDRSSGQSKLDMMMIDILKDLTAR